MEKLPKISILVPAYNEEAVIGRNLSQLCAEVHYPNKEIIVGVDNGDDKTLAIARDFEKKYSFVSVDYDPVRRGVTAKVNSMLKKASGEIIIKFDADMQFGNPKKCLYNIAGYFRDKKLGGLYYGGERDFGGSIFSFMEKGHKERLLKEAFKSFAARGERFITIIIMAYRTSFFPVSGKPRIPVDVHCFRKKLVPALEEKIVHDDIEFAYQVLKKGYRIDFAPNVIVYTPGGYPFDSTALFNQKVKGNVGWLQMSKRYGINYFSYCAQICWQFFKGILSFKYKPLDLAAFSWWCVLYFAAFLAAIPKRKSHPTKVWKRFERKVAE